MLRTQIYLPEELRKQIDQDRAQTGESLADYIRKAVEGRTKKAKKKKPSVKDILKALDSLDPEKSGWKDVDVIEWQRQIREDRF